MTQGKSSARTSSAGLSCTPAQSPLTNTRVVWCSCERQPNRKAAQVKKKSTNRTAAPPRLTPLQKHPHPASRITHTQQQQQGRTKRSAQQHRCSGLTHTPEAKSSTRKAGGTTEGSTSLSSCSCRNSAQKRARTAVLSDSQGVGKRTRCSQRESGRNGVGGISRNESSTHGAKRTQHPMRAWVRSRGEGKTKRQAHPRAALCPGPR